MNNLLLSIDFCRIPSMQLVKDQNGGQYYALPANSLHLTEKGAYLSLLAIPTPNDKFGNDYMLKPYTRAVDYKAMSDEARRQIPILGSIKEQRPQPPTTTETAATTTISTLAPA